MQGLLFHGDFCIVRNRDLRFFKVYKKINTLGLLSGVCNSLLKTSNTFLATLSPGLSQTCPALLREVKHNNFVIFYFQIGFILFKQFFQRGPITATWFSGNTGRENVYL